MSRLGRTPRSFKAAIVTLCVVALGTQVFFLGRSLVREDPGADAVAGASVAGASVAEPGPTAKGRSTSSAKPSRRSSPSAPSGGATTDPIGSPSPGSPSATGTAASPGDAGATTAATPGGPPPAGSSVAAPGTATPSGDGGDGSSGGAGGTGGAPGDLVDMTETPIDLPDDGTYISSRVLESGRIRVDQWIRSAEPVEAISLAAPTGFEGTPRASDLEIAADGRLVAVSSVVGFTPVMVTLEQPAALVHLTYQLDGVVERSESAVGRALARVTSLDVDYEPETDSGVTRVSVMGSGVVLNLSCTRRNVSTAAPRPCGESELGRWVVELTGDDRNDQVMAQLNLQ